MADMFPPSLVEQITELERDLLARQRIYAQRTYTRRLSLEKAERRLAILREVIADLRRRCTEPELAALEQQKQRKKRQRQPQRETHAA